MSRGTVTPCSPLNGHLAPSVRRLCFYLREKFPFSARVTIADNGSADRTWAVAMALSRELPDVTAIHLDQPGRGRALRAIWSASDANVLAYMDVDLSTDLNALLPLVAPLLSGHSDIAIGTRLARGSRVVRGPRREMISRSYNLLLRASLGAEFTDAQCGFKAIRRDQARALLPLTEDTGWFFDTELLVLGERAGLRIHEVPVDWIDDTDSRVDIVATALADLRGIARLGCGLMRGTIKVPALRAAAVPTAAPDGTGARRELGWQIAGFSVIGVASTGGPAGTGTGTGGFPGGSAGRTGGTAAGGTGGPGGLSGNTQVGGALVKLLEQGASGYTWVAATEGSQEAAPLELATGGEPVMAIGGFNGTDPAPTLAEFKALVAEHKIHYYLGTNSQSFGGGQGSSAIATWVASHFTKETVGGTTVYDLTTAVSS